MEKENLSHTLFPKLATTVEDWHPSASKVVLRLTPASRPD
jgi:hypothetical protein